MSLPLEHRASGDLFYVNAEHRINAAFPPYVRGEARVPHTRGGATPTTAAT
jgi:hypothetical protein